MFSRDNPNLIGNEWKIYNVCKPPLPSCLRWVLYEITICFNFTKYQYDSTFVLTTKFPSSVLYDIGPPIYNILTSQMKTSIALTCQIGGAVFGFTIEIMVNINFKKKSSCKTNFDLFDLDALRIPSEGVRR